MEDAELCTGNRMGALFRAVKILFVNPLSLISDQSLLFPYSVTISADTGCENKGNDHQTQNVLMFYQIL